MYVAERLIILAEECAEVQQGVAKCLRFGLDSKHYYEPSITNQKQLARELGDLQGLINNMVTVGILTQEELDEGAERKINKMKKWTRWLPDGSINPENTAEKDWETL